MPDIESGAILEGSGQTATSDTGTGTGEGQVGSGGAGASAPGTTQFNPSDYVPKSEFTKIRQKEAEQRRQLEAAIREREQVLSERESKLVQAAQLLQQRLAGGGQGSQDPFADVRDLPYVDGATVARLMEHLRGNELGGIVNAIRQRDQALSLMHNQVLKLQKMLNEIQGKHVESEFDGRLRKVRDELGLPDQPWAMEFLQDIYLSHEGDDLADEFPNLARTRLNDLRKAIRELDKAEAEKAKRVAIPGQGGNAVPSAKLNEGYKNPAQLADELWPLMQDSGDNY
jgi:hypothetical protein